GVCLIKRGAMPSPESFAFTKQDAELAGILKLKTAKGYATVWAKYFKDMIIRKARIRALRAVFADAITGAAFAEDFNWAPDLVDGPIIRDVTPSKEAEELKEILDFRKQNDNIENQG